MRNKPAHKIHQLKYLLRDAIDEIDIRFNSLPDEWADDHVPPPPSSTWLKRGEEIIHLGSSVYGVPESVGYPVSPMAIVLATLDHYIVDYSTLYISRKVAPQIFPFHVMGILIGSDADTVSWGKLYDDEWERLSKVLNKLLMATFAFANWQKLTLSNLERKIQEMRNGSDLKPQILIDDVLLLEEWHDRKGIAKQSVILQLEWMAHQHDADIHLVMPSLSSELS